MKYALLISVAFFLAQPAEAREVWSKAEANAWYDRQPWLIGTNYIPSTAINQLEMWQAETFDPVTIDRELGWAQGLGMNTVRVFLHDLLWEQDPEGFKKRIDSFLTIAAKHEIKPMFVLFDSCWDPDPKLGPQHPPIPGVHNSGWVQSPGRAGLEDPAQRPRLKSYVEGIVGAFAKDDRVLVWDIWNEPDSPGGNAYRPIPNKEALVEGLIVDAFEWARAQNPVQPLTSSLFETDGWRAGKIRPLEHKQLAQSDILSFHDYRWPEDFAANIAMLESYGRPILATEYLARGAGSTFDGMLPIAKKKNVGVYNWGFVDGKTQTRFPWDSWQRPYVGVEPTVWFHDILRSDGTPYRAAEAEMIRRYAAAPKGVVPKELDGASMSNFGRADSVPCRIPPTKRLPEQAACKGDGYLKRHTGRFLHQK